MAWMSTLCGLALIILEGVQAVKGQKQTIVLPSWKAYEPQQQPVQQDTPSDARAVPSILIEPKTQSTQGNSCLVL